ncbi:MAG: CDP-diacylglycerol--serine O-phosphatidyltransferase [Nitrospinae bacterium]|nr:CDP-diacylglycerol--serine O-phosphatidyltransferase [Nitrospinota bacterium]
MNKFKVRRFEKGIYILPNLLTTASVFCSFYAMVSIINGKYYYAAISIIVAIIFDGLDGKIARLTNSTSNFGLQLDSLADAVSFGVAPALLIYAYTLHNYGRLGWLAAFLFVICGLLRLARFNIQEETDVKKNFTGLPIPGAAGFIAITVIMTEDYFGLENIPHLLYLFMVYALAILMVSNIPYTSFKGLKLSNRRTFHVFLIIILIIYLIAVIPQIFLFLFGIYYIFTSPFLWGYKKLKGESDEEPLDKNIEL